MRLGIKFKTAFSIAITFLTSSIYGQIASYSNEFLRISTSARFNATGNAYYAFGQEADAVFYSPAGLTNLENSLDIHVTHSEYMAGSANFDVISLAYKSGKEQAMGFGIIRMGIDNIPNTLYIYDNGSFNLDNLRFFSVADNAFFISYSRKYSDKMNFGGSLKLLYRHEGQFANAFGLGLDLSATYKNENWIFALNTKDVTGTYTAWFFNVDSTMKEIFEATNNELPRNKIEITPPSLILSAARKFTFAKSYTIKTEIDLVSYFEGRGSSLIKTPLFNSSPQLGIELSYKETVFVRAGINNFQRIPYFRDSLYTTKINFFPSAGVGLKYKNVRFDYSFGNFTNNVFDLSSHFFSLNIALKDAQFFKKKH